jgi:L-aminopeptidase/D-esterase-like protein
MSSDLSSQMPMLPPGFAVGHWTDGDAATGCTVILCPPGTVGGGDVRGNSPGSRELVLLGSEKSMQQVHAVLLTGGSAFGLAAADGVMQFLEERGIGYHTPWGIVPIVPSAVIFDLNLGSRSVRPAAAAGYQACSAAEERASAQGSIGAGTGATIGKWGGMEGWMKGGLGIASLQSGDLHVAAVAVVNAVGDVLDERGAVLAGARLPAGGWRADTDPLRRLRIESPPLPQIGNTTLVAILTNCALSKVDANRVAQRGHDGLARAIQPVHTMFDGDVVFALMGGAVVQPTDVVAELGAAAAASAIRSAVRHAAPLHGVPAIGTETR